MTALETGRTGHLAGPTFHPLRVVEIEELTDDAVALRFEVPAELAGEFAFTPGQHVAVRVPEDEERRSYSVCSAPGAPLRVGVRRIPGGAFSGAVLDRLRPGDELEVMTPTGRFGAALPGLRRPGFVAAGSGITPILAMATAALTDPAVERVSLVDINRSQRDVMFLDELADLKDRYPERLQLVHVLTREPQESELLSVRPDADGITRIRTALLGDVDGWFLCGPQGMVTTVRDALLADGIEGGSIHTELFHADAAPAPDLPAVPGLDSVEVEARLGGRRSAYRMSAGETVLDALLRTRGDAPYACKGGVCGTCRARVVEGSVAMAASWALEPDEIARGDVLTCQSRPTSDRVVLDYDA
ncbi:2Fe-2S iron-sulfur cluster-binding protein [Nocardioides marmorisolisilvae]|uniref:Phenylacetic acid degradation protein n=1 Tax=Nocardioides marmorisolisilvae TaxID=1542737 RepID=A0A3N0DVY4_9ACTN|nr:2Fe-2S iron-sulfur cluster-binding protein [Nocardioides marmorisolisilvae]RNL79782.1 phenylacetic acid degradation protein [Nocardioides marmorisolisilvae]